MLSSATSFSKTRGAYHYLGHGTHIWAPCPAFPRIKVMVMYFTHVSTPSQGNPVHCQPESVAFTWWPSHFLLLASQHLTAVTYSTELSSPLCHKVMASLANTRVMSWHKTELTSATPRTSLKGNTNTTQVVHTLPGWLAATRRRSNRLS